MDELIKRSITGIIFIGVLIGSIILGNYAFALLFLFFSIIGQYEFFRLMKNFRDTRPLQVFGLISGVVVYSIIALIATGIIRLEFLFVNLLIVILPFVILLKWKKPNPFGTAAVTILSLFYIVVPFGILNFILNPDMKPDTFFPGNLIGFFVLMWTYDVFAYLIGTIIGQHKLLQNISPKKTWEGSIGSGIITLGASYVLSRFIQSFEFHQWLAIALIIIIFGTLGDITESMLKRSVNVKDSGSLLPGHGGVLDRFDGVLFCAPVVLIYLTLIR